MTAKKEPWYAPRECPVCKKQIGRNRQGQLKIHMWNREAPRKKRGSQDPFTKELRQRCPASGLTIP